MTSASRPHNRIVLDLARALEDRLHSQACEVFAVEVGVLVNLEGTYTYPDVMVVCGEQKIRADAPQTSLENPTLLFEVLSPSTEMVDRNQKLEQYRQIPSLLGYFLVAQDKPLIEAHTRSFDDWQYREYCAGLDASLHHPGAELRDSAERRSTSRYASKTLKLLLHKTTVPSAARVNLRAGSDGGDPGDGCRRNRQYKQRYGMLVVTVYAVGADDGD